MQVRVLKDFHKLTANSYMRSGIRDRRTNNFATKPIHTKHLVFHWFSNLRTWENNFIPHNIFKLSI